MISKKNKNNRSSTKYNNPLLPLVSIITPTFNRRLWLPLTLQSFIRQTYKKWECIVVNDAGEDVSDIIEKLKDNRIKYIVNSNNIDLAASRNVALQHLSGDEIITCDDDDGLMPECIEFRLWRKKKLNNVDVVYSRVLKCYYEKQIDGSYKYLGENIYWRSPFDADLLLVQNISPGNGIMYSRQSLERAGPYDTELRSGEDWDRNIAVSRHYPFYETEIIDSYCSFRINEPKSQMTGDRNFTPDIIKIIKKWRYSAKNIEWVTLHQNQMLLSRGINPADYGL